eukprot:184491_1
MRSKLEHKFKLQDGELSNHRSLLSSLMDQYIDNINANLEASDLNELDSYINNNKNHNNRNNNKNHNNPKSNKTKKKNQMDIMDINYTEPSNSSLFHIYTDSNGIKYSIMLNQTDISYGQRGHNKFYAIQLLEHNQRGTQYKFITKWGRVGNRPQTTEVTIDHKAFAIEKFRKKFKDKTKNDFGTRHFNAVKGKYIPIAMENKDGEQTNETQSDDNDPNTSDDDAKDDEVPPSTLDAALVRVLQIIFCRQLQLDTAKAFDYDLQRSPLGQLSKP